LHSMMNFTRLSSTFPENNTMMQESYVWTEKNRPSLNGEPHPG